MITFLALILIFIFLGIASIHFYWAFGGRKWSNLAIPTQSLSPEVPLFKPRIAETLIVALCFLVFAWIIGMKVQFVDHTWLSQTYTTYAIFGIALIFLVRSIGEFRYVGFFKSIKHTPFGQMDTRYYSPLCLFIAIITLIINL
jgi:hypothetical protein